MTTEGNFLFLTEEDLIEDLYKLRKTRNKFVRIEYRNHIAESSFHLDYCGEMEANLIKERFNQLVTYLNDFRNLDMDNVLNADEMADLAFKIEKTAQLIKVSLKKDEND